MSFGCVPQPSWKVGVGAQGFVVFGLSRQSFSVVLGPVLELALLTRLASNSQRSACPSPPVAGIKGVRHHCLEVLMFHSCSAEPLPGVSNQALRGAKATASVFLPCKVCISSKVSIFSLGGQFKSHSPL